MSRRLVGPLAVIVILWLLWSILCWIVLGVLLGMTGAALEIMELIFWSGIVAIPLVVWFWGRRVQENPDR